MASDEVITVRKLLTQLDGRGLACDKPEQVSTDLLLFFRIGLDTPLKPVFEEEKNE